ncbi:MAG: FG-GAP repeat domain-containing protein [Cyclobacteriaceae bacterium]
MKYFIRKKWFFAFLIFGLTAFLGFQIYKNHRAKVRLLAKGEELAKKHCTTCHIFPDPELLTRELWKTTVLPNMGSRLGMRGHFDNYYSPVGKKGKPILSQEEWNILVYYYLMNAPDSLEQIAPSKAEYDTAFFSAEPYLDFKGGIITALKALDEKIYIAEATDSILSEVNITTSSINTTKYDWPITDIQSVDNSLMLTSPGYLHPADHQMGMVMTREISSSDPEIIIDSLRRSLRTSISDFDQNGYDDLLICEFGHNYGQLSLYFNDGTAYKKKILAGTPGAIRAQIHDFNQDGLDDFMVLFAQGDERLVLYTNMGNQQFKPQTIYRFPSIYGSLYFELADFNHDGLPDILYTNGDNGDYSPIPKPYHGVRILINQGENKFSEEWFYPMYGAAMAKSFDFDQDGKLDIMATSNFTRSAKPEEEGLIFFHQKSNLVFEPFIYKNGKMNQWNLLEFVDIDDDGDQDVLIGAMNLKAIGMIQSDTGMDTTIAQTSILLLRNKINK